ncbi:MAG: hypothetical protein AB9866_28985 [Syntrophobacteraceae bacterium]
MSANSLPAKVFPDIFPPREIRILGAGRFGRIAAERLKRRFPDAAFLIADSDSEKVLRISEEFNMRGEVVESVRSLTRDRVSEDVWLIPAVPVHMGFEWLLHELNRTVKAKKTPAPEGVELQLPNPLRSPAGTLYASFATFICPDHCSEPAEICTHTGSARPGNLYEVFGSVLVPEYTVVVLRSWQLAPGVGGYPARSLNELLSGIRAKPGKYLVATSCRCHGVMDALEWANV